MWVVGSRAARSILARMPFTNFPQAEPGTITKIEYDQVCQIIKAVQEHTKCPVLIDVRPPAEIDSCGGTIPTSKNIPLSQLKSALEMPKDEFKANFGFEKPSKDDGLVFFCKAGIRAMGGAEQASSLGYKSYCYTGSWLDWCSHSKK